MTNTFSTFDLGLATTLNVLGFELVETDKSNIKKVNFIFKVDGRRGDIEKVSADYFNNKIQVSALSFHNEQKALKNRIYSNY